MAVGSTLLNSSHSGVCVWRRETVEVDRDRRGKPVPWSPGSNGCILTFLESITLLLDTLSWPILTLEGKAKATRVKRKAITSGNQGSKEGKSLRSWGHKEGKNPTWGHKEGRRNLSGGSRNWEGGGHRRGCGNGWGEVVGGSAPGRVREGGTPPAQLGGVGERCKLPHRGLGRSPRSQRFLLRKPPQKYVITD